MSDGNNTRQSAEEISAPSIINDQVGPTDINDYYTFTVPETTVISIGLFGHSQDLDLFVFEGSEGNAFAQSIDPADSSELVVFTAIAGVEYTVQVNLFFLQEEEDQLVNDPYQLVIQECEPDTTRVIERFSRFDVPLTDSTRPFFNNSRWEPGQTLGYSLEGLLFEDQRAAAISTFEQLSRSINLTFVPDRFGVFNLRTEDDLGDNVLGIAELVDNPFNRIRIISDARPDVVVHEIGHGFGLEHPIEDNSSPGDPSIHGLPFTIMNAFAGTVATGQSLAYRTLAPTGFLVLDLEYAVDVYGTDPENLLDNTYVFDTSQSYFEGFHDGGGIDTIEIIDEEQIGVRLNLNPRGGSNFGAFRNTDRLATVFNTDETILEHAVLAGGADTVFGSEVNNRIEGKGGDDVLQGRNGDDTLFGDSGNDGLNGGNGADLLVGGAGLDTLTGGAGGDTFQIDIALMAEGDRAFINDFSQEDQILVTGASSDGVITRAASVGSSIELVNAATGHIIATVRGAELSTVQARVSVEMASQDPVDPVDPVDPPNPNDLLTGSADADFLETGIGDDTVNAGSGDDTHLGNEGADLLRGQAGDDQLFGGDGSDTLSAGSGDDVASGGSGDDRLLGGNGDDTLLGGGGVDLLVGGPGADILNGGGGNADRVTYSNSSESVNLILQIGDASSDGAASFGGEAEGDQLISVEQLIASQLDDSIGLIGAFEAPSPTLRFFGLVGDDTLTLDPENTAGAAVLNAVAQAGSGNDILTILNGDNVRAFGQSGNDTLVIDGQTILARGGGGDDVITLVPASEPISATVDGQSGNDLITGSAFADALRGNAGDDTLITGGGSDTLAGGGGADLFRVLETTGNDTVTLSDFRGIEDTLEIATDLSFDAVLQSATSNTGGVTLTIGSTTIILEDIAISQLTNANLILIPLDSGA